MATQSSRILVDQTEYLPGPERLLANPTETLTAPAGTRSH